MIELYEMNECPLCGEGELESLELLHQVDGIQATCLSCGMSGPTLEGMDNAVEAWNTYIAKELTK